MNQKHLKKIYHVDVNENLMVKNVIQIKSGTMTNVDMSAKKMCVKKVMFRILLYVVVKMADSIVHESVITSIEIAEKTKSIITKIVSAKSILTNPNKKVNL